MEVCKCGSNDLFHTSTLPHLHTSPRGDDMSWKVLVTARAFWVSGKEARAALESAGCTVVDAPVAGPLPIDDLIPLLRDADAVVASSDPYNRRVFSECPHLKVVSRCGVGYDSIDVSAATESGVVVTITPGAMTEAVADYAFALILAIARKIPQGDALMRSGGWGEYPGVLVYGKTLGLVGFGAIGRGTARRAVGFGMRILAYDPAWAPPADGQAADIPGVEFVGLDELLAESDFVSLHAPATPETRGMFDADRFGQMKKSAYFINTARGALVNEPDLIQALTEGVIAGAAIDVYTKEPVSPDDPLRTAPNCVLTPHNAFNAVEAAALMSQRSAENVLAVRRGVTPDGILNPIVLTSSALRHRMYTA